MLLEGRQQSRRWDLLGYQTVSSHTQSNEIGRNTGAESRWKAPSSLTRRLRELRVEMEQDGSGVSG